jgi:hypothetical protein
MRCNYAFEKVIYTFTRLNIFTFHLFPNANLFDIEYYSSDKFNDE